MSLSFGFNAHFTTNNIVALIAAMKTKTFMRGLNLYFAYTEHNKDTRKAVQQSLIDTVLGEQCPPGLKIEFFISMHAKDMPRIVDRLMRQTILCGLQFGGFLCDSSESDTLSMHNAKIRLCCQRNKLMYDHPELIPQIKRIAMEYDMYQPGVTTPPVTPVTLMFKLNMKALPDDVVSWKQQLEEFKNKYSAALTISNVMKQ